MLRLTQHELRALLEKLDLPIGAPKGQTMEQHDAHVGISPELRAAWHKLNRVHVEVRLGGPHRREKLAEQVEYALATKPEDWPRDEWLLDPDPDFDAAPHDTETVAAHAFGYLQGYADALGVERRELLIEVGLLVDRCVVCGYVGAGHTCCPPVEVEPCDECGADIPTTEPSMANAHHAESCSLHEAKP